MSGDSRPPIWVGHISLPTDRLEASRDFMLELGMRPIAQGDGFAVLELRGGTHLVLLEKETVEPGPAPFDLMVEDLDAAHAELARRGRRPPPRPARPRARRGRRPSPIRTGRVHRSFTVDDPSGARITFHSSHVSDRVV